MPPLILSMGDPAGIGPEITIKAWQALRGDDQPFFCIAPVAILQHAASDIGAPEPITINSPTDTAQAFGKGLPILDMGDAPDVKLGTPNSGLAPFITGSIKRAVELCLAGQAAGLVTNPISKDVLYKAGFTFPGHTEYLGVLTTQHPATEPRGPVMMLTGGGLRVALATVHLPLKEAAAQLETNAIIRTARVMHHALIQDFGIAAPRIAITGLNPHAGENGALGREEIEIINPAATALRDMGINATDAQPADTLFHAEAREGYDAVLAMYHDQGLIPVKTLDFHGG
ncbi:MAG: 4-hydroxythreonine-4-phosphate dehydrogenase PdxA, partial [Maricaulaceae bacterium]